MHGPPSAPNAPIVRVVMTDRDVMDRVGACVDRAVVLLDPRKDGYKMPFAVSLKGLAAVRLMISVRAALGASRRAQIEEALEGWGAGRTRWNYAGMGCAAETCVESAATQGLCESHFNRWYKATRRGSRTPFKPRPLAVEEILREPAHHEPTRECDVAWLAGLLEGEGAFSRTYSGTHSYPVISLNMCSVDVVQRAAALLGAIDVHPRAPGQDGWSPTLAAKISGGAAATWMQRLRPLMGERRRNAIDRALEDYYPERLTVAPPHCVVPGCDAPHRGRGLCHKHYMAWSRDIARGHEPRVKPLRSN